MEPRLWRRSRVGKYLRHMPRIKHVRGTWLHRQFGDRLFEPELWKPERKRIAGGVSVGVFFGMLPLPIQMLGAAIVSYFARVNIPAALAATWVSNPFTMPFALYIQYKTGCILLGRPPREPGTFDIWKLFVEAPAPLLLGSVIVGIVLAAVSYPITLLLWDVITPRLHARKKRPAV